MPNADQLFELFASSTQVRDVLSGIAILLGGILVARMVSRRIPVGRLHPQHQLVVRRVAKYAVIVLAVIWALRAFGVELGVLLGAAGLLTVAVGFAAQTSASNLISGLFLMGEQPFVIGDTIRVGESTGEVVSIDLLSVRLRSFDNLLVRIPNESMLKSNVVNLTHFPIRRFDVLLRLPYGTDMAKASEVLLDVAAREPVCLAEPPPQILFLGFGESAIEVQYSVWAVQGNLLVLRNNISNGILTEFARHGIAPPAGARRLSTDGAAPLLVKLCSDATTRGTPQSQ